MARVTVEDCLDNVANRFELVMVASKRARQLEAGKEPLVEDASDKPTVLALREIANGLVTSDILEHEDSATPEKELVKAMENPGAPLEFSPQQK